jgi:hypothetical protein
MLFRKLIGRSLLAAALTLTPAVALAFNDADYPDWKGQWTRLPVPGIGGAASFDPTKPNGLAQQAPLTPEYQRIFEANLADQAMGGQGIGRIFGLRQAVQLSAGTSDDLPEQSARSVFVTGMTTGPITTR